MRIFQILTYSLAAASLLAAADVSAQTPPAGPYALYASDGTYGSEVQISWQLWNPSQGGSLVLYRSSSPSACSGDVIAVLSDLNQTSFVDDTAIPQTIYYYSAHIENGGVGGDCSNADEGYASGLVTAPDSVSASTGSFTDFVYLTWSKVPAAASYRVYRSRYAGSIGDELADHLPVEYFEDHSAVPGVEYYYSVEAVGIDGSTALSSQAGGLRATVGTFEIDSDGDRVKDSVELLDNTNPYDAGSHHKYLNSPAFVRFNTYLNQHTFLELNTTEQQPIPVQLEVLDAGGFVEKSISAVISPAQQLDIDVNELVSAPNTYGMLRLTFTPGAEVFARTSSYRAYKQNSFSFAYARRIRNGTLGKQYAVANAMDPSGQNLPVATWAEIANTSSEPQSFVHNIYRQNGQRISSMTIDLPAFGSADLPAGSQFGPGVYLNEVAPIDGAAEFLFSVSRFGVSAEVFSGGDLLSFGMLSHGKHGSGDVQYAQISNESGQCWSQANWLEIANVRPDDVTVYVSFNSKTGIPLGTTSFVVPGRGQVHLNASAALNGWDRGVAAVATLSSGALIVSATTYYHDCAQNVVQTASIVSAKSGGKASQFATYNTNLAMENRAFVAAIASGQTPVMVKTYREGQQVSVQQVLLGENEVGSENLNATVYATSADSLGLVEFSSGSDNSYVATLMRRRVRGGKVEFAFDSMPE
ncbi:MAG: hypothetical protein KDD66_11740 [Bdellovibrionales bacterium]|nr:hypothetical protein [Bdellovibrionales bacterium]